MAAPILPSRCDFCKDDPRSLLVITPSLSHDITGQTFERLTAQHFFGINNHRKAEWCCVCTCGGHVIAIGAHLRNRNTKSCGCLNKEHQLALHQTHGMTHTAEFNCWQMILNRCLNPKATHFQYYGGRGITICARWKHSFEAFYADMGTRPGPGYSIDRYPDPNGPYCPENCRWADRIQQANNMRNNRLLTWEGRTQTLAEWVREYDKNYSAVLGRLNRGMDIGAALTLPPLRTGPRTESNLWRLRD